MWWRQSKRHPKPAGAIRQRGGLNPHGRGCYQSLFACIEESVAHHGELSGVADGATQCPVAGAGGPDGEDASA
jgi:hypothetical protein